ncbi:hypothetical protein J5N97_008548 [Dioscorea zingiberensis]|uniref:mitogen-activated protein kinase kinase kinase n=1 Tax=Dioscorea zingiberensis TaxID=325984 RepID=A0A9D5CVY2_9LILI|nr:hypothetical protein J5N97_008548 [Dioscorea zingiberensis]
MPWWKPSSSPSSSSSSPRSPSSPRRFRRDTAGSFFGRRDDNKRLTRQRKLRHLSDVEVGGPLSTPVSRTVSGVDFSPARSVSSPVPLPLPESSTASPQRERESGVGLGFGNSCGVAAGCPLPSPRKSSGRADGEECTGSLDESAGSRLNHSNTHKKTEHFAVPSAGSSSRKIFQEAKSAAPVRVNIPAKSAPTSGLSSPVVSPRRSFNVEFFPSALATSQGPRAWPQLDIPSPDTSAVFSPRTSPENVLPSPDCSPLYSPSIRSPALKSRNPSAPPSPLHPKFSDNCNGRHDCNSVAVHPLPLPPGAPSPVPQQSGFTHQITSRTETAPMTNQWQKGKLIGSGTFGNVYVATNRQTGALCAMKEVNIIPDDTKSAECLKQLEQEIKVLSQLKHPNIVQYYGSETIEDRFYIYLEYVHPGSINKYVREHCGAMTESVVRNFTRHILNGLEYLHSTNTMHRDIKGANLLVDVHGVVKLADFGMAKHLNGAASATLSMKGTPYWMAPEVMQATMNKEVGYDLAVDIWSLGCTIIEMFTGKPPWSGLEGPAAMFKVLHKDPLIPETLSNEGKDFLRLCFRRNPADRPKASELLDHSFIKNSRHYNLHGSIQAFSSMKLDNTDSPRERPKSRSESSLKGKQLSNGDTIHSPETSESAASRFSHRSVPEMLPSIGHLNPFAPNHTNGLHSPGGNHHSWVLLPKPRGNEG